MSEKISPDAGKPADPNKLLDVPGLVTAYFAQKPDPAIAAQRVSFGTSGHRGSAFANSFNEDHILAITQAICLYRSLQGTTGPLFIGIDTHALSIPALATALEVLAANAVTTMIDAQAVDAGGGFTPTPIISHAILGYNRGRHAGLADGIVVTPSHNPPPDGGFKYNTPNGGPADTDATGWIERKANEFLEHKLAGVARIPYERALKSAHVQRHDYITPYVADLANIIDMEAIRASGVKIGIDPLGGAAVRYWAPIIERYKIAAAVVNDVVDPTFRFMTYDWDGKIRMDCSSPYAMTRLIALRETFDVAFANDTDSDRHGIVTRASGLMKPNHYLAVAIDYLWGSRTAWSSACGVGKTIVSSALIDRVAQQINRPLVEVPVGFKWFVNGLTDGSLGFGGEESAGASFLRRDGSVWTTDKDGLIAGLLAAEMTARSGVDPGTSYERITRSLGAPFYERIDAPATADQRSRLKTLSADDGGVAELAGEKVIATYTRAPGNNASIGGIKIVTQNGWFALRPSGTEDVYKIYAESFQSEDHLHAIQAAAQDVAKEAFGAM
jgi:phosphoglucomutase